MDTARQLIDTLIGQDVLGHDAAGTRLIETHTAWVILAGEFAWKIKKPVNFGFLDYSTLEKRRYYCAEELRLNRRFAPQIYLDVVAITGSAESPRVGGEGPVLEYAVRMHRFAAGGLLSQLAQRGRLEAGHIDQLVERVAGFHRDTDVASQEAPYGEAAQIKRWVSENFRQIRPLLTGPGETGQLEAIQQWTESEQQRLEPLMLHRKRQGAVRECHGDLHLGNITLIDNRVTLFDCIEFNPELRWIDVISETAFLVMDLADRGYPHYAARFLNGYLQHSGDYEGLGMLRYYLVYRALVRAKVAMLRRQQTAADQPAAQAANAEYLQYMQLAQRSTRRGRPALLITYGVSGTGKSTIAGQLCEAAGMLQLRSDIERKRMAGLEATAHSASAPGQGLYTADHTDRTYQRLAELATTVLQAGYAVVVDATFLQREQRDRFRALAGQQRVPFIILECRAADTEIERRVRFRAQQGDDPSEATLEVLQAQRRAGQALAADEIPAAVSLSSDDIGPALDALSDRLGEAETGGLTGGYF
ncbi:MAG: AAA family ATPase [Thiogranum sp.]